MKTFDLIKGVFDSDEAKEVLLYLIDGKIQFHQRRIFSDNIKYGIDNIQSKQRIEELQKCREEVLKIIDDESLYIHSQIEIKAAAATNAA